MAKQLIKVKEYKNAKDFDKDAQKMLKDGWELKDEDLRKGTVAVGTTVRNAILTGGIGLLLGGRAHTKDKIRVTWLKGAEKKKCPKCAEQVLKDAAVCRFCQHAFDGPNSGS